MSQPRVVALYRHPVKGFTPEPRESLTVRADGRIDGDRVLAFRFANAPPPNESGWMPKTNYAVLVNTPGLARVSLRYDETRGQLSLEFDGGKPIEAGLDEEGRERLSTAVAEYIQGLPDNPLAGHPERLPLRLVGDGLTPRFHDTAAGDVTLFSRESLSSLGEALYDPELDGRRFRANIVIEGAHEWEELGWAGQRARIGAVEFNVMRGVGRCLATHANPVTGERDRDVMNTLTRVFSHEKPTFAVLMRPLGVGEVRVGDEVVPS